MKKIRKVRVTDYELEMGNGSIYDFISGGWEMINIERDMSTMSYVIVMEKDEG